MALTEEQRAKLNAKAAARSAAAPVQDVKKETVVVPARLVGQELNLKFSLSLLMFWLKGSIYIPSNLRTVQTKTRNTILGIIPAGKDEQSIPMSNISATMLKTKFKFISLIIGAALIYAGIATIGQGNISGSLIELLIGVFIFGAGIQTRLEIQRSGSTYEISVPFYERSKMAKAKKFIDEAVNRTEERRDVEMAAQMIVDSMKR